MVAVSFTEAWHNTHPKAAIGLLEILGVTNQQASEGINARKPEIIEGLKRRYKNFSRQDFNALPTIAAYRKYYGRFKKSFHVQLQLESLVLKGKSLPTISPLVDANFMAEVESLVLTAGHDVEKLLAPIVFDASRDSDAMVQMNGSRKAIRPGDMIMRDRDGISCSVIYGQDNRSMITKATKHALYVAYAPAGVAAVAVKQQLDLVESYVKLFAPDVQVLQNQVIQGT